MSIRPLVGKRELRDAYATFASAVTEGGEQFQSVVNYQGVTEEVTVTWHADKGFWVLLDPEKLETCFLCAFGVDNPETAATLTVTCEINPANGGYNRQCGSLFICDSTDSVYLAHNGKIRGGRGGAGRATFLASRDTSDVVPVEFPERKEYEYIAIGRIDDSDFLADLAKFVHSVAAYKEGPVAAKS